MSVNDTQRSDTKRGTKDEGLETKDETSIIRRMEVVGNDDGQREVRRQGYEHG